MISTIMRGGKKKKREADGARRDNIYDVCETAETVSGDDDECARTSNNDEDDVRVTKRCVCVCGIEQAQWGAEQV